MLAAMLPSCSANSDNGNDMSNDDNSTETYEVSTSDLWTQRGSNRIYGRLYTPEGETGRLPLVIFSHGFGGSYINLASYAEWMAQMGYMAYCFDFCGGSSYSRSDGSTTEMSVLTERADLEAIIEYFKTRDDVDASQITLAGASQGGFVSALTAAATSMPLPIMRKRWRKDWLSCCSMRISTCAQRLLPPKSCANTLMTIPSGTHG